MWNCIVLTNWLAQATNWLAQATNWLESATIWLTQATNWVQFRNWSSQWQFLDRGIERELCGRRGNWNLLIHWRIVLESNRMTSRHCLLHLVYGARKNIEFYTRHTRHTENMGQKQLVTSTATLVGWYKAIDRINRHWAVVLKLPC